MTGLHGRGLLEVLLGGASASLAADALFNTNGSGPSSALLAVVMGLVLVLLLVQDRGQAAPVAGTTKPAWWMGVVVPFALTTWVTFLYLGIRFKRMTWLATAAMYLGLLLVGAWLNWAGNDRDPTLGAAAFALWMTVWLGGILHALLIRATVEDLLRAETGRHP